MSRSDSNFASSNWLGGAMKSTFALSILLVPGGAMASELVKSVPKQFIGEWNARLSDCGTGYDDSALEIRANRIEYYESEGPLKAIVTHGRNEVALIAQLSGEGQTWLTTAQFKLSPGRDKLISAGIGEEGLVRYRCPRRDR